MEKEVLIHARMGTQSGVDPLGTLWEHFHEQKQALLNIQAVEADPLL